MNSKLIRLHNGQWINPKTIMAITVLEKTVCDCGGAVTVHPPRIVVHAGNATTVLNCDDAIQAQQIADDLASQVNAALLADL